MFTLWSFDTADKQSKIEYIASVGAPPFWWFYQRGMSPSTYFLYRKLGNNANKARGLAVQLAAGDITADEILNPQIRDAAIRGMENVDEADLHVHELFKKVLSSYNK